jgi:aryl-alcohol dehydrogenase-like predicted oxidoreductase
MEYRRLGHTDLQVSAICLGTMTWGGQNSEAEAHEQLDAALDRGVNLIDTAEMYPFPVGAETQGRTESYIGSWLGARGTRDKVVIATKVTGRSAMRHFGRGDETRLDRKQIHAALDGSLARLGTDYVDLYQLHWPDRRTNFFGQLGYDDYEEDDSVPLEESLGALADLVKVGKVRHIGVSNETPWGLMRFIQLAETHGLPRVASIQNPYSLLNRVFDIALAEVAWRESCGLLAYSPLGFGVLTGKYLDGAKPKGARLTLFDSYTRYVSPKGRAATAAYVALAREHGLDPAQMAIAFVTSRPFVTSAIIGATSRAQLETDIDSVGLVLADDLLAEIDAVHAGNPFPCP